VALVSSDDEALATLDDLRTAPRWRTPGELLQHLERIDTIRSHGLILAPAADLPAAPLGRLARSARTAKPANLAALQEPGRTATLAALFQTLEATALDDAVELFDALATDIFSQAEEAHSKSRLRDLYAAAIMLRDVGQHVVAAVEGDLPLAEWKAALFEQIARIDIQTAIASVDNLVTKPDDRRYQELRPHWRRVRTLFSGLLQRTEFASTPNAQPVIAALDYLRGVKDWSKARMINAPTQFMGAAWKRHAIDPADRVVDGRAYVFAAFDVFQSGLKPRTCSSRPASATPTRGRAC